LSGKKEKVTLYIIIGVVVLIYGWIIWEVLTAPMMPDDYSDTFINDKKKSEYKDDDWFPDNDVF
jgi:hypothetical protein